MTQYQDTVNGLSRPRLLLEAVRHALGEYNRERVLRRFLGTIAAPRPQRTVPALLAVEEMMDDARRSNDASYSPARHIEALTALIGETRLLTAEAAREAADARDCPPARASRAAGLG
ncbi:DUF6477 family protein [Psychromarinibacter halotolerans]|uniref:DUF6477 family protein n=1 Tax=Psychromarinibacter halotolerans TaxID=1775175 RepID=A0ABV7GR76_9RHOB|nr:DUF6477 family protein [Psychromarinibacter halotolerans]MAQ82582.1 hypothetical protein [Maritimibacter sp.]MDF0595020.1 DUF6477 family protein [Psychromarinibacter halotolerans]